MAPAAVGSGGSSMTDSPGHDFLERMERNKKDFLSAVKAKESLDSWVIVMGKFGWLSRCIHA